MKDNGHDHTTYRMGSLCRQNIATRHILPFMMRTRDVCFSLYYLDLVMVLIFERKLAAGEGLSVFEIRDGWMQDDLKHELKDVGLQLFFVVHTHPVVRTRERNRQIHRKKSHPSHININADIDCVCDSRDV